MAVFELTLESLMKNLDGGRVAIAFAEELRRVAADCDDRPGDDKPRKVVLTLTLKPVFDIQSNCLDSVLGKFQVTSSVPQRRSKAYSFGYRHGGRLVFNDLSEENIHQRTIDEAADDNESE